MRPSDPENSPVAKSQLHFPVVGVGASAGGLTALRDLLGKLPSDPGMAFVVVMHLSPDHESALGSILQRGTGLTVVTVTEVTLIEVNHVYVISPALKLEMTDGKLRVSSLATLAARRSSIDLFFRSLAQAHAERAICIVLTGTGSDGAQGLRRVKELGGITFAQSPEEAEYDGMPQSAIRTGMVDFILPIDEIAAKIRHLWENAKNIALPSPPADLEVVPESGEDQLQSEEALASIKALLRERTGHDFSHYKRGTVLRRLERRMQVNAVSDLPSYRRLLDTEPRETPALLQDMLISVTNFFRDPDSFAALESAIRNLTTERPDNSPFRAWIAGCATGEEAYSLAIVLREILGRATSIQLFASDIDERAVASARTGLFPESIAADIEPHRVKEFFTAEPGGLRINKAIRDMVVFSTHNALSDPPFTRMDLISCRNLLIYLDRVAQTQVMRSFHFALKPQGLLFLGSSETTDAADGLFEGVNKSHRIYRAAPKALRARSLPPMPVRIPELAAPTYAPAPAAAVERPPLEMLHERILRNYGPPTVLVDADTTVLHVSQRATHLLRLPEGAPTNKLLALARPELRAELRAALTRAIETGLVVEAPRVTLKVNGETHTIVMTVRPAFEETPKGLLLIVFDEAQDSLAIPIDGHVSRDPLVESLESELLRTQERLRTMVGESNASTEELRASNEELQTINEELRSTTEELETSREELQAVNEELTTVNSELTLRIEDSSQLNDDLQNLMNSADIGTVFVDREMRLKRFTPQAATLFNLLPSDSGRPLLDITHRLNYPQLADDVHDVLKNLTRIEREVGSNDNRWFLARAVPYRTTDDRIEGAVLAFFDITSKRIAEENLRISERRMQLVAESMRDYAIITMDESGIIDTWSRGAEKIFGYSHSEAVGQSLSVLFSEEERLANSAGDELRKARDFSRADDSRWHVRKDGTRVYCSGITTPLHVDGRLIGFAKIARNLTEEELRDQRREAALATERATRTKLQEVGAMKDEFLAVVSHELKNPLSVIQMNAQLIQRLPSLQDDERALRAAASIKSAVASQLQIINDLLELSRANMGKMTLTPSLVNMAELVRNIADAVRPDVEKKEQRFSMTVAEASIYGDAVRAEQIVWNLITNAIKFTPPGGSIDVRLDTEEGMAVVTVTDDGIGMEPAHVQGVFEMFRQVDAGPSRRTGGLGIGLALVKQLAELHGGRVSATSQGKGCGSCFKVWLPLAITFVQPQSQARTEARLQGVRLLLVDDEPELLGAFSAILESEGAEVHLADNAEQALALAQSADLDVVVSDIGMPIRDGYWLAQQLREQERTLNIAMVAVSGMAREVDRSRAIAAGFDAHLGKPVDLEMLESAVVAAMSQRKRKA